MPGDVNRQWILRDRPQSHLTESDFELRRAPVPEPGPGEALTRTLYISVDAANRAPHSEQKFDGGAEDFPQSGQSKCASS